MKIFLINRRYHPEAEAGPAFAVQALAEGLVEAGHAVHVICLARTPSAAVAHLGGGPTGAGAEHHGVVIHRLPPGTNETEAGALVERLLNEHQPEVVHTHWLAGFPLAQLGPIVKRAGIRLVHTLHEYRFLCDRGVLYRDGRGSCRTLCADCGGWRITASRFANHVDGVIGVSRFCLDLHLRAGLFDAADTRAVIATGFKGPEQPLPMRQADGDAPLRLGYLGRISVSKGLPWLLRQLSGSELAERVTVTMAGEPPAGLPERLAAANPGLSLRWLGFVPPSDLMRRIDWLVVPSLCHDALARVIFEAFAFGIPVIASRMGGIPELIDHGHNGRLFSPGVPGDLLTELRWIDESRALWPDYRQAAWESRTAFRPESIVAAHLPVYQPA